MKRLLKISLFLGLSCLTLEAEQNLSKEKIQEKNTKTLWTKAKENNQTRLAEAIAKFQAEMLPHVPKDFLAVNKEERARLATLKLSEDALQIGDEASNFNLPNAVGKKVSLYKLLEANDFVVINFYRGAWCPYCNIEMEALREINKEVQKLGGQIVAISPETPDLSLSMKEKHQLEFEVLSDKDYKVEKEYGLIFSVGEKVRPFYEKFGYDIPKYTQNESYELPIPATYVVNKNKKIIFAFIDEDYTKRAEPQAILNAIKAHKK